MKVTVIGCGVIGLTTGVVALEAGHDVRIVAEQLPFDTVSVVAAAIWSASSVEPQDRVPAWALRSREVFAQLATDPTTGIRPLVHVELARVDPGHTWGEDTPYVTRLSPADVPQGYATGLEIDGFNIDPSIYLRYLIERFESGGGSIELRRVDAVDDVAGDVVVNCTGLGARELVGDQSMFPIRGQTIAVSDPGIDRGVSDDAGRDQVAYVYPRTNEVILGGTRVEGDADVDPDPVTRDRILADTAVLDPRLVGQTIVAERVGLRPGRPTVRLETDTLADGRALVHNYGHGGAGYIMSWGCAEEAAQLATRR